MSDGARFRFARLDSTKLSTHRRKGRTHQLTERATIGERVRGLARGKVAQLPLPNLCMGVDARTVPGGIQFRRGARALSHLIDALGVHGSQVVSTSSVGKCTLRVVKLASLSFAGLDHGWDANDLT